MNNTPTTERGTMSACSVCLILATKDVPRVGSKVEWAAALGVGEASVRRHLKHGAVTVATPEPKPEADGKMWLGAEGGTFTNIQSDAPISDWSDVFLRFNRDPAEFIIDNDSVTMSAWQQSKRLDNGDRDTIWLYSYNARFKRISKQAFSEDDINAGRRRVQAWKLPKRTPGTGLGAPVAAVLNLADMQLGKSEGGGITATLDRLSDGLEHFQSYVERQRSGGRNINELVIVNNGDPFEGIAGNYTNQTHTVQGGLRAQMNTALDVWEMYARELFPQYDIGQFVSVHCNHTQFGRQGGTAKSITGDEDTGSAFLAEALQRILRGRDSFDHVRFTIPHDEMNVYTTIAGVPVGFNHGHKIPGNDAAGFEKWLNGQVRGDAQAHAARIWITAHRHHFAAWDMGSATVFQCPSCEGETASKWLRDMTGKFSRSGILALLVGEHDQLGWSDPAFL